ncbi:MAG: magnesium transporter CorA family protein [Saprospiraceae bacterium]|nr:magnesium transporter CorA family protein [Saprospiraceae bacterium]
MVRYYEKQGRELIERSELQEGYWINISPPFNRVELETLAERLTIPIDFLDDSLDIDERTRFEEEDDIKLIVINAPILGQNINNERTLYVTVPIGIILSPDHIITITSYSNPVIEGFLNMRVRRFNPQDSSMFALQILEQNVYHYLRCLKDINIRRNTIEQEVYSSSRNQDLKRLLNLEKSLIYFVTALSSNALLMSRMDRIDFLGIKEDPEKQDLFEDIIVDNSQAQEMAHVYSNILGGTMEALASVISNNLNEVMQRLTLVTIVLMVPTLVSSFYGMNVSLPFKDHPYAFWFLLGVAVIMVVILLMFFRTRKLF